MSLQKSVSPVATSGVASSVVQFGPRESTWTRNLASFGGVGFLHWLGSSLP